MSIGKPLAGVRVIESSMLGPAEMGGLLADLGADVVKVEPPDGDITRLWGRVVGGVPDITTSTTPESATSA